MANITVSSTTRTIVVSKAFAKLASQFGTNAYDELQTVRRDYPNYRVVVSAKKASKNENKGITVKFMRDYIEKHDDEKHSIMTKFMDLRAESEEAKAVGAKAKEFFEIRDWFYQTYPAFAEFEKRRDALLAEVATAKKAA